LAWLQLCSYVFYLFMLYRPVIVSQLLVVDEVIRAGRNMRKPT